MNVGVIMKQVESPETDQGKKTASESETVIQYWVMEKVDPFRKGNHIYETFWGKYVVVAYCPNKAKAADFCWNERMLAKVEVHDYNEQNRLGHKNQWTFLAWIFLAKHKRL